MNDEKDNQTEKVVTFPTDRKEHLLEIFRSCNLEWNQIDDFVKESVVLLYGSNENFQLLDEKINEFGDVKCKDHLPSGYLCSIKE
jgi:hypothetical protein